MVTPVVRPPPREPSDAGDSVPDEAAITRLVHAFYARARTDWLLGPVFEAAVDDWSGHLDTLVRFWCSVLLRAGTYRGNPMAPHPDPGPARVRDRATHRTLAAHRAGHRSAAPRPARNWGRRLRPWAWRRRRARSAGVAGRVGNARRLEAFGAKATRIAMAAGAT